jgi:hypothetical protein
MKSGGAEGAQHRAGVGGDHALVGEISLEGVRSGADAKRQVAPDAIDNGVIVDSADSEPGGQRQCEGYEAFP